MRIAVVCDAYPSPDNQIFVFVEQLVCEMIDQGADISVIAPQSITNCLIWHHPILPSCALYKTPKGREYKVYRPKYFSLGNQKGLLDLAVFKMKQRGIMRILRRHNFDVVYSHFWDHACFVSDYCREQHKPLFVACGEGDTALEDLVAAKSTEYLQRLRDSVTGVISVSTENKRKCIAYGLAPEDKIAVFPNCVNTALFHPSDASSLRRQLGAGADDFIVSFVGGFIERKGSKRLADAITMLHDDSLKSIFIGKTLSANCAVPECEGILLRREVVHDEIPQYLNCSDLFVLPTQNEGCCNAIVEALACGLPVVSSDGAFNDDILSEENSIRVDPNDVSAIAEAIAEARQRKDWKRRLSGKITECNPYSLPSRAERIMDFIAMKIKETNV